MARVRQSQPVTVIADRDLHTPSVDAKHGRDQHGIRMLEGIRKCFLPNAAKVLSHERRQCHVGAALGRESNRRARQLVEPLEQNLKSGGQATASVLDRR